MYTRLHPNNIFKPQPYEYIYNNYYSLLERRRRWSDSYKGVPESDEEDEVDNAVTTDKKPADQKLKVNSINWSRCSYSSNVLWFYSAKLKKKNYFSRKKKRNYPNYHREWGKFF